MQIRLVKSKAQTVLIFYATEARYAKAKEAIDKMESILSDLGFPVEEIVEAKAKGVA